MRTAPSVLFAAALTLAACSSTSTDSAGEMSAESTAAPTTAEAATTSSPATTTPSTSGPTALTAAEYPDRPFDLFVPSSYDGSTAMPLVMLLHGYGATGVVQDEYFGLQLLAEQRGLLYVHPEGTLDETGRQFWNATDACCDDFASGIDDSSYLLGVIAEIAADYRVDPSRIFVVGHSNGGFMSYRMACDHADVVAAIVSLAGATFADASTCTPANPVSVLEIHGTDDEGILYGGGERKGRAFPGAVTTVSTWAGYDGCGPEQVPAEDTLDLTSDVDGAETTATAFGGCPPGIDVALWTVEGGGHVPNLTDTFAPEVIDFLLAHPKPT